jgi:D-inositol-3-phosphate glycosyltransferase
MNVYVRELMSALARSGVECTTFTRADAADLPAEVLVEPGHRVVHVEAGPHHLPKEALPEVADAFRQGIVDWYATHGDELPDVIHGNYWLSGVVGHRLKHDLDVPFVSTFHTLARVKAEGGDLEPVWRDRAETEIIGCADAICVSCPEEEQQFRRLYGDPQGRIEIIAPGVEHAFFAPGDQAGARHALDLPRDRPILLFVGRIQPLKGPDVAVRALAELGRPDALLLVVGGASGTDGADEVARLRGLVDELGLDEQVRFVAPQPHHILSTYYRAADLVVVPSRSESFGLVALEAAACGVPVVASAVGGLVSLVDHESSGLLVPERDPAAFASAIARLLAEPGLRADMGRRAVAKAAGYTWGFAAARLRRLYVDLAVRELVVCP